MSVAPDPNRINLSWLVRLRWGAIAGQLATIAVVEAAMRIDLRLGPLLAIVAVEALSNLGCAVWLRRGTAIPAGALAAVMGLDVLILTGLLLFSGGSYNPFSFLYLVNIALAAVVLRPRWTWALLALAAASSGLLFAAPLLFGAGDELSHAQHMHMHMQGMWIAFVVAAAFIVYFVSRVRRALDQRERDLAAQQAAAARTERLGSLATLAAGAAHELATPLGTIAMAARELERGLRGRSAAAEVLEDVALIRQQVERCRLILDQMAADAGTPRADAPRPVGVGDLLGAAVGQLERPERVQTTIEPAAAGLVLEVPLRALAQALRGIAKNACEASPAGAPVTVAARARPAAVEIEVADRGVGMSAEVLARAGEPFFTTKEAGRGMGLGLFLARTVVESLGGSLRLESRAGEGTRVTLRLPARPVTVGTPATGGVG